MKGLESAQGTPVSEIADMSATSYQFSIRYIQTKASMKGMKVSVENYLLS